MDNDLFYVCTRQGDILHISTAQDPHARNNHGILCRPRKMQQQGQFLRASEFQLRTGKVCEDCSAVLADLDDLEETG